MSGDHEQRTFHCKECLITLQIPVRVYGKSYEGHDLCRSCRPLVKPPERILTEEELNKCVEWGDLIAVIASHRALLAANAALSFKIMELQKELAAEKNESDYWRLRLQKEANRCLK